MEAGSYLRADVSPHMHIDLKIRPDSASLCACLVESVQTHPSPSLLRLTCRNTVYTFRLSILGRAIDACFRLVFRQSYVLGLQDRDCISCSVGHPSHFPLICRYLKRRLLLNSRDSISPVLQWQSDTHLTHPCLD